MSHLTYTSYPGFGELAYTHEHHSQVVRVDNQLIMSGQVGLQPQTATSHDKISFPASVGEEIDQAFANVDMAFRHAGGKGAEEVYKLVVYLAPWTDEATEEAVKVLGRWFPNHRPVMTVVGVEKLAFGARIEVDAYAHTGGT